MVTKTVWRNFWSPQQAVSEGVHGRREGVAWAGVRRRGCHIRAWGVEVVTYGREEVGGGGHKPSLVQPAPISPWPPTCRPRCPPPPSLMASYRISLFSNYNGNYSDYLFFSLFSNRLQYENKDPQSNEMRWDFIAILFFFFSKKSLFFFFSIFLFFFFCPSHESNDILERPDQTCW